MINTSFQAFVNETMAKNRIGRGDLRRLQRDLLPDGVGSRDEADLLLALDRSVDVVDPAWTEWLVPAIVDFVVWGERPTGYIGEDTARWLAASLARGGKTAHRIASEVAREAQSVYGAPIPQAKMGARLRPAPIMRTLLVTPARICVSLGNRFRHGTVPAHRGA